LVGATWTKNLFSSILFSYQTHNLHVLLSAYLGCELNEGYINDNLLATIENSLVGLDHIEARGGRLDLVSDISI
jgi:hypothetical protein